MFALLVLSTVVGTGLIAFGSPLGRRAFLVGALPMAAALVWVSTRVGGVTDGSVVSERASWVDGLGLEVVLRLNGLAATMTFIVAGIGVGVMVYAASYFASDARDLGRLAGLLVLFSGSMLGLVWADNILILFAAWELTSITSFLLIGNRHTESRARAAALHALLVTGAGGLALLAGLLLVADRAGSYELSVIAADPPAITWPIVVLLLVGAFSKSAQYPFHSWLPGAMAAPTPVSAYLHSATMVKAGVFLLGVLSPMFATAPLWRPLVVAAGVCSLVFGGLRALLQNDLKLLLAFGTVSQLGLLTILFGLGTPAAATAGWVLLLAHAAFKATLFMVVGIIDHQTGTRDIRELPPLTDGWRSVQVITVLAAASMAGIPLTLGFVAKELAYESIHELGLAGAGALLAAVVVGAMLTTAYAVRFCWSALAAPQRRPGAAPAAVPPPPSVWFVLPAGVFAAAGLVLGLVPAVLDPLATASLGVFGGEAEAAHLAVWHGFGLPVALSALAFAGGAAIAAALPRLDPWLSLGGRVPSGAEVYVAGLGALGRVSTKVTSVVQSGSLPVYSGVILLTAALLPAGALAVSGIGFDLPPFGSLAEAPLIGLLLIAAFGAAMVRRRFAAALFLSVVGYAMAGVFVLAGAPDLALTQVTVETLSTVVFVLVLRRLPPHFERQSSSRRRVGRVLISCTVAAVVFVFALIAGGYDLPSTVSEQMIDRSLPDGHGRNVVNVTLVDFRGFDTLGEIAVLVAASIGAVALARAGRRTRRAGDSAARLGAVAPEAEGKRLAFVDVSAGIAFPVVMLMSVWLLFSGHNQPGGGFVGGLLAGSAITLRFIAGGVGEVRHQTRFQPWTVLGSGLFIAVSTAVIPIVLGRNVLQLSYKAVTVPGLGKVSLSSTLAFDVGVYIAVIGMVLMAFEAFGDEPEEVQA